MRDACPARRSGLLMQPIGSSETPACLFNSPFRCHHSSTWIFTPGAAGAE